MKPIFVISALVLSSVSGAAAFADPVVFNQQPDAPANASLYESNMSPTGYRSYDDFTLSGNTTLSAIGWFGRQTDAASIDFTISYYANVPAQVPTPGALLFTEDVAPLSRSFISSDGGGDTFQYTAATPYYLLAGTYWASVVADTPDETYFYWDSSEDGDNHAVATPNFPPFGYRSYGQSNLAFELDGVIDQGGTTLPTTPGSATPEPGSLILTGTGLLSLAGAVRRRLRRG